MRDCQTCGRPVDGLFCARCEAPAHPKRTPPPMGFDGLRAVLKPPKPRDVEAELERAAIEDTSDHPW